jgi:predicted transcriptional regulator
MTARKRTIEMDVATARALESRAAEAGLSVPELLAEMVAVEGASTKLPHTEIAELDRQWAAINAGEPTVAHDEVVRWLDTWGTPRFRTANASSCCAFSMAASRESDA